MIGPALIHQRKTFDSYFMLPSYMIRERPALGNILVFGTDGDVNLSRAFESCLPFAHHLLCDIHMKDNIESKLVSLSIKGADKQLYIDDIFGKQIQENIIPGLVDCKSEMEFTQTLESLKAKWTTRHENGDEFLQYFIEHKSDLIKSCMSSSLRSVCGLGFPPKPYTQNANESINNVIKKDLKNRKQTVPEFIRSFKRTVSRQKLEIKLAITNQSDFKLKEEYKYLDMCEDRYFRTDKKQKEAVYKKYQNASLKPLQRKPSSDSDDEPPTDDNSTVSLSIKVDHTGITSVPYPILESMFDKAGNLFHSKVDIVPLPGNRGASNIIGNFFVTSSTNIDKPHLVTAFHTGQITCDNVCPRWETYKMCSHTVAVSEQCGLLKKFIDWFKSKSYKVNLSGFANINLPVGRGKKPHKATQIRKGGANKKRPTVTGYIDETPQETSKDICLAPPKPPDCGYILYFLSDCDNKVSKCYGCKGNLKRDGLIPPKPGDLVVVSRARREYIKEGIKTYGEIGNIYFHMSENCIKAHNNYFVSSLLYVSPDVAKKLEDVHKTFLRHCKITF